MDNLIYCRQTPFGNVLLRDETVPDFEPVPPKKGKTSVIGGIARCSANIAEGVGSGSNPFGPEEALRP